jgi:N-acetylneuraminic acid mutarotase
MSGEGITMLNRFKKSRKHNLVYSFLFFGILFCVQDFAYGEENYSIPLTLNDRIRFQKAIEEVYWKHSIWPKENKIPKPSVDTIVTESFLRAKVETYLRKSNALEIFWQRPIQPEQLQAEMDRMAKTTQDPDKLRELFSALGNDPFVIAETLARQTFADRLIRDWFATDQQIHKNEKAQALALFQQAAKNRNWQSFTREYSRVTIESNSVSPLHPATGRLTVSPDELQDLKKRYRASREFQIQENADAYWIERISSKKKTQIDLETLRIPKTGFSRWWEKAKLNLPTGNGNTEWNFAGGNYRYPDIATDDGCDKWEKVLNLNGSISERYEHTAVWTGTEMIVWGGYNGMYLNTGGRYNPATDTWTEISTGQDVPLPRSRHTAVWTGTEMIVWGGFNSLRMDSGGRYDPVNDTWTQVSITGAPSARSSHSAIWTGSEMIVWGGTGNPPDLALNTGGRYDPVGDTWQATSTFEAPGARGGHTAVWTGSEMLVWGGSEDGTLGSGSRYDPQSDSWTSIPQDANVPQSRSGHTAVWTGTEMIIWGGAHLECSLGICINYDLGDGGRFNPVTNSWTTVRTTMPRTGHTAIWTGSVMIVYGGIGQAYDTGATYNPANDGWDGIASPLKGRYQHTAVWTGNEMIIWGGWGIQTYGDGARYSPSSGTWVGMLAGNTTPEGRSLSRAVWTGNEMIVWGGRHIVELNTGGRYDPATNTWTPTSTGVDVPTARFGHTAVWTGNEMIVWGGLSPVPPFYMNTGARYNPMTDSWLAASVGLNVPEARTDHTAIWSGSEMIVWGGQDAGSTFNSGARYDVSTDSWFPTSTAGNVPTARIWHTAVWTGQHMIIWGGDDGNPISTNSGGLYDPANDTWLPTSTNNAPSPRSSHTAVWTGHEMIVWGGAGFPNPGNTGGKYNPLTDTWQQTSVGDQVPSPTTGNTAVWTGSEMIVWGGSYFYFNPVSGGRYTPASDSWLATSIGPDVPMRREGHVAVWTGTKMIVWGGGLVELDSGGIYSPGATVAISPSSLPKGEAHTPYNQTLFASGGTSPFTFAIAAGRLPDGLNLDPPTGVLSGIPLVGGIFFFTVNVTDSLGCTGNRSYNLNICQIYVSPDTLSNGTVGVPYNQTTSGVNGTPPYSFAVTSGALPLGLSLNSASGLISGTPTTTETASFTITATDSFGCVGSTDYTVVISTCAVIDVFPNTLPNGFTGIAYNETLSASGGSAPYTFAVTSGSLPPGLTLSSSGSLTGTPTAGGVFNFTVTATDSNQCAGNRVYYILVNCIDISLSPAALPNGATNVAYNQTISASGGTAPYTFAVTSGSLPPGLTLNSGGLLNGTPTTTGIFNFTVTATDNDGCTGNRAYSITVICSVLSLSPATLPNGTINVPYNQTITAIGGTAPYAFAITSGSLPPGLTLDSGGAMSGTPNTTGVFNFAVTATDSNGCAGNHAYSITVSCPVITLLPATLPNGTINVPYNQTVSASGGTAPYSFAVTAGSLPNGLTLGSDGLISGTPTTSGIFNFSITASDSFNCTGSLAYSIAINCPAITISPPTLPSGTTGVPYTQNITASGGTLPYNFLVTAGSLPDGLTLSAGGTIIGTPTASGTFNFSITASDSFNCTGSLNYFITINCLFCDDFEDGVLNQNWTYIKPAWTETGGSLIGVPTGRKALAIAAPVFAGCSTCSVEATLSTAGGAGNRVWLLGWYVDKHNKVELMMKQESGKWVLKEISNGQTVAKGKGFGTILPNVFYDVKIDFDGTQFIVTVDGTEIFRVTAAAAVPSGTVGFQVRATTAQFGQVIVN